MYETACGNEGCTLFQWFRCVVEQPIYCHAHMNVVAVVEFLIEVQKENSHIAEFVTQYTWMRRRMGIEGQKSIQIFILDKEGHGYLEQILQNRNGG